MGLFTSFQLKSRDAATRRRAALKLGAPGRTSAIASLEPLLDDPDWSVRAAAAEALGLVADPAVVPLLSAAVRNADSVQDRDGGAAIRRAAVEGLARVGAAAVPALAEALGDRNVKLREAAIEALGAIGGAESARALVAALADDRSNLRQAAAPALARAAGRDAVEPLRAAIAHKDPATRRAAALALGSITEAEAALALPEALADRDRGVREAAVQALVAQASPAAVGVLCAALLEGDRDLKGVAAGALKSFAWSPADAAQRVVHAVLHGRYEDAAREGEAAIGPLLSALADRDAAARRGAAEALGAFRDARVLDALAPLLGDQDAGVRDAAVAALARSGSAACHHLVRALDDRGGPARAAAARAIAAVGEGAVTTALLAELQAGQPANHGGLRLRVVQDREGLDAARTAADHLAILAGQLARTLPADSLHAIAAADDVMLIEPGRVPDPDERVSCDGLRKAAQRELGARGAA